MSDALDIKQSKKKELIIEHLKKAPIIQLACERADVGRATYYRWRKGDSQFAEAVDEALVSGSSIVNDMAESKLITAIKEQNMTAIIFWLKHHHRAYATRVELTVGPKQHDELTPEQQELVRKALTMAALTEPEIPNNKSHD